MTANNIVSAFNASQENLSRLAYRTAYYHRVQHKHFPRSEDAIFGKTAPAARQQSINQQYQMARLITKAMH